MSHNDDKPPSSPQPPDGSYQPAWTGMGGLDPTLASKTHYLTGTITNLERQVAGMENSLGSLSASVIQLSNNQSVTIAAELERKIAPLQRDVATIKGEILPQLREFRDFVHTNVSFLQTAVAADGLMKGFQGQLEALEKRVGKVEAERNDAWNRRLAIASVILALLGAVVSVYVTFFK